jgi:hypothetical protein
MIRYTRGLDKEGRLRERTDIRNSEAFRELTKAQKEQARLVSYKAIESMQSAEINERFFIKLIPSLIKFLSSQEDKAYTLGHSDTFKKQLNLEIAAQSSEYDSEISIEKFKENLLSQKSSWYWYYPEDYDATLKFLKDFIKIEIRKDGHKTSLIFSARKFSAEDESEIETLPYIEKFKIIYDQTKQDTNIGSLTIALPESEGVEEAQFSAIKESDGKFSVTLQEHYSPELKKIIKSKFIFILFNSFLEAFNDRGEFTPGGQAEINELRESKKTPAGAGGPTPPTSALASATKHEPEEYALLSSENLVKIRDALLGAEKADHGLLEVGAISHNCYMSNINQLDIVFSIEERKSLLRSGNKVIISFGRLVSKVKEGFGFKINKKGKVKELTVIENKIKTPLTKEKFKTLPKELRDKIILAVKIISGIEKPAATKTSVDAPASSGGASAGAGGPTPPAGAGGPGLGVLGTIPEEGEDVETETEEAEEAVLPPAAAPTSEHSATTTPATASTKPTPPPVRRPEPASIPSSATTPGAPPPVPAKFGSATQGVRVSNATTTSLAPHIPKATTHGSVTSEGVVLPPAADAPTSGMTAPLSAPSSTSSTAPTPKVPIYTRKSHSPEIAGFKRSFFAPRGTAEDNYKSAFSTINPIKPAGAGVFTKTAEPSEMCIANKIDESLSKSLEKVGWGNLSSRKEEVVALIMVAKYNEGIRHLDDDQLKNFLSKAFEAFDNSEALKKKLEEPDYIKQVRGISSNCQKNFMDSKIYTGNPNASFELAKKRGLRTKAFADSEVDRINGGPICEAVFAKLIEITKILPTPRTAPREPYSSQHSLGVGSAI